MRLLLHLTRHCARMLRGCAEVVKKVVKKVAKKPAKKTLRRESARAGVERGAAMLGDTFIVPTGPVAIGVGVWILVLLRFVIFYGFFGGE